MDSMFALARAAQQSVGIALVPMPVSKAWFESGQLMPLHSTVLVTEDYYWMALGEESRHTYAAKTFWHWIGENLRDVPGMDELDSSLT